uniref:Retrovirus-related Pol polyprotein from transposon TNT 1-94-like beta-barrel domain-containing protein n=1 Tax=Populus alba TaxID=43335 RepID=A0A4U5QL88_POPAL|nr:hypothetical protein D5086_0000072530 [Populus alba]
MIADLKNLDVEIDDEDKALLLLNSLPDTYEHLVTTLLYGKEKIKFIDVSNALVNNEYRKEDQIVHKESTSEALTVRGRTNPRRFRGRGRSRSKSRGESSNRRYLAKDESAFCHKKGHWKKDCPIKGNKEKDEPAVNVAREEDERDFAFMVSSPEKHCGEWILDSACSYHMSPNKHLFSRLEEFDGGVVFMGNNNVSEVKGIGTIHLKMHNGVVKTLTEVRYVPDLKKNLFSLGVLESSGYKIIMHGGVLRAIRGALVVLRGTRIGNLYFLDGSTVTGIAVVSKSLEDAEADNSRLWHMRLGHAGEKALQGPQEKSQEKEKQSGDAQQVELETSVIPVKTVQTIPTEGDSDESSDEEDATTPATTQQESIATNMPKPVHEELERWKAVKFPDPIADYCFSEPNKILKKEVYTYAKKDNFNALFGLLSNKRDRVSSEEVLDIIFKHVAASGNSLLHVAASHGSEGVKQLLCHHFPLLITRKNFLGDNALHLAARAGRFDTIQNLVKHVKIDPHKTLELASLLRMKNNKGNTPLHDAVIKGCREVACFLLYEDLEVSYHKNKEDKSPLYLAVESCDAEMIASFKEAMPEGNLEKLAVGKPDIMLPEDIKGGNLLHLAASMGFLSGARLLVSRCPVAASQTNDEGNLPIHVACQKGH